MSNELKYYARNALYSTALLFSSGTLIQTFMSHFGVPGALVGLQATLASLTNLLASMLFSGIADSRRSTVGWLTWLSAPIAACFLALAPVCLTGMSAGAVFAVVLGSTLTQTFFVAIRTIFDYKLPYLIIDMRLYNRLISVNGIISGLCGIGAGALLSALLGRFPYGTVMLAGFAAAIVLTAGSALFNRSLRIVNPGLQKDAAERPPSALSVVRMPIFRRFALSNLLRGLSMGLLSVAALFALDSGFSDGQTAVLVTALSVANIAGSFAFALLTRRLSSRFLCFAASLVMLLLPLMTLAGRAWFAAVYSAAAFAKAIIDYAVPSICFEFVPFAIAGVYHTWRLMLTTAGSAAATLLAGALIGSVPSWTLLLAAALGQLWCGIIYMKRYKTE